MADHDPEVSEAVDEDSGRCGEDMTSSPTWLPDPIGFISGETGLLVESPITTEGGDWSSSNAAARTRFVQGEPPRKPRPAMAIAGQ
jgi:hypothetical protein